MASRGPCSHPFFAVVGDQGCTPCMIAVVTIMLRLQTDVIQSQVFQEMESWMREICMSSLKRGEGYSEASMVCSA